MFRPSPSLLLCRITLFTRPQCSLCSTARAVLSRVQDTKKFDLSVVDVMERGREQWKEVYEFDVPVIHVDKAEQGETTSAACKLMHRFTEGEVERLMDEVERSP